MSARELPGDWRRILSDVVDQPWYHALISRVADERVSGPVYPPPDDVFTAFHLTPFDRVRVLILGQDPYHGEGQAHGLAFSVRQGVKPPPSLNNIFKELAADLGCATPGTGCLERWAQQGVMLLNAVLTVRAGQPNSHKDFGWEHLTDAVIRALSQRSEHTVFLLWGNYARKKARLIDRSRHTVLETAHPSPLSARQWFGSRPFSQANAALRAHGQQEIDWTLGAG